MEQVSDLKFEDGIMYLRINGENYAVALKDISHSLTSASSSELYNYSFSPSGFGIHWPLLDEDLSVAGILRKARKLAA